MNKPSKLMIINGVGGNFCTSFSPEKVIAVENWRCKTKTEKALEIFASLAESNAEKSNDS